MKKDITPLDRELGQALMEIDITETEPDFRAMFANAEAIVEQRRGKLRMKRVIRRTLLVASLAICLLIGSVVVAVLSPSSTAQADSWFDRAVFGLRTILRLETAPGEVIDAPMPQETEYANIDAARQNGYIGYVPAYLPEGYAVKGVQILSGQALTRASFEVTDGRQNLSLSYFKGRNVQLNINMDGYKSVKPFMWGEFVGAVIEYDDGSSSLSCVNKETNELIACKGQIAAEEIVEIITHMEKAETPP